MEYLSKYREVGLSDDQIDVVISQEIGYYKAFKEQYDKEYERFKQDCRKRALEMAREHFESWVNRKTRDKLVGPDDNEPNIITHADLYYQWLITIPENK